MLSTQHSNGSHQLQTQQRQIQFEELSIASLPLEAHLVPLGAAETRSLAGFSEFSERSESIEGNFWKNCRENVFLSEIPIFC